MLTNPEGSKFVLGIAGRGGFCSTMSGVFAGKTKLEVGKSSLTCLVVGAGSWLEFNLGY